MDQDNQAAVGRVRDKQQAGGGGFLLHARSSLPRQLHLRRLRTFTVTGISCDAFDGASPGHLIHRCQDERA